MKKFRDFLGNKEKASKKKIFLLFTIILIPNIFRQIMYFVTSNVYGSTEFITSFETKAIYALGFPYIGVLEEVIIGIVFTFFWFNFRYLRFFAYGWIADAFIDFIFVFSWVLYGVTPLQIFGLPIGIEFVLRELIFSYLILGIITYKLGWSIRMLSAFYLLVGIIFLFFIVF
ncbi:MAG: hypothetical protein KJ674_01370 [Nanoarchaeota archaeon]|nr:hypothetical protein [Nanoarchaeota archaeon]